LNEMLLQLQTD